MADDFLERFLGSKAATPNPVEAARRATKRVLPKRFWRSVTVLERAGGFFGIALDGKPTKTPRGNALAVPSRLLAEALVAEWAGLGEEFDPGRMPLTRLLHRAIDDVAQNPGRVAAEIVKYAGSDLLCYRDADNARLGAREAAHWDAPLAWAHEALGARFDLAAGVKFIEQPKETLAAVARFLAKASIPFGLAALHSATTLTGSAILALALSRGRLSPEEAWAAAHVDEDFQIEAWGADQEAMARRAAQRTEFDAAALVLVAIDSA
jgi:chaperone required for assembly of F1-ATPase